MSQQKVYKNAVNESIEFATALKILPREGNLAYEYNPFRNYRVEKTSYKYNGKLISALALAEELKVNEKLVEEEKPVYTEEEAIAYFSSFTSWSRWVPNNIEDPELIEPGDLIDFETDELTFDINHPVDILPQYSYDNSVNLILNDGKNTPRLINSRFSPLGRNKYQIVDRKGNNDTNIYDQGSQFDIDTSLYKRVVEIPRLKFLGVGNGGGLPVGNYHFYFRYADADGNETDFVAESGLVSIFIGNDPGSINSGFREENSHKTVQFLLSNVDSAYQYVTVYYTRSTSDILQNADVTAKKIDQKFLVNNFLKCNILITGYDAETTVTVEDINPMYLTADSVVTQEKCQNMLFLGNITKPTVPYKELEDLSLRFLPYISNKDYPASFDKNYNATTLSLGYYDPKYIYNNVGYWNHELYRLGIVYILSNSELSPVFNIRGIEGLATDTSIYTDIPIYKDGVRHYISIQEDSYLIVDDLGNKKSTNVLENAKGVIEISMETKKNEDGASSSTKQQVFGIGIQVQNEVIEYLKILYILKDFSLLGRNECLLFYARLTLQVLIEKVILQYYLQEISILQKDL